MNNHLIWVIGLIILFTIVCGTIIHLNENPYVVRVEMDNNTLEAIKSVNYSAIKEINKEDACYFINKTNPSFTGYNYIEGYIDKSCEDLG